MRFVLALGMGGLCGYLAFTLHGETAAQLPTNGFMIEVPPPSPAYFSEALIVIP